MKNLFVDLRKDKQLQRKLIIALIILITIVEKILCGIREPAIKHIQNTFWTPIMTVAVTWIALNFDFKKNKDGIFFIAFAVWAAFVCVVNLYWPFPYFFEILFLSRGCFAFPYLIDEKGRMLLLKAIAFIYTGLFDIINAIAVMQAVAYVKGTSLPFAELLKIKVPSSDPRLYVINHPNTVGISFCIGIVLSIMLLITYKNIFIKLYSVVSIGLFVLCLSFGDSRTSLVATMMAVGVCFGGYFFQKSNMKNIFAKSALCAAIIAACLITVYFMGMYPKKALNAYGAAYQDKIQIEEAVETPDTALTETDSATEIPSEPVPKAVLDDRDFNESNDNTLNGRIFIWGGVIDFIKSNPSVLIKGYDPHLDIITAKAYEHYNHFWYNHIHNGYLYILAGFGLPGCLIVLAFLIKMALNCFKVVFLKKNKSSLPVYMLPAIIVALLFGEILDITTFNLALSPGMPMLFLAFGYMSYYSKENIE